MVLTQGSFCRAFVSLPSLHVRYASRKPTLLEHMAEMVSRLAALETRDAADPSRLPHSEPKPNALKETPIEEPIPPLPAYVRGYPTPWITEYDTLTYVYPLYTRGWGQSLKLWKPPPPKRKPVEEIIVEGKEEQEKERYTMLLSAKYKFKDYDSAVEFFLKLVKVAKAENHHPSVHIVNGNPFTVTVTTQTDSAKRPIWVEEEQPQEVPGRSESPNISSLGRAFKPTRLKFPPLKLPGITLRDIRLAILAESIYSMHFASHLTLLGRHIHPANFRLSWDAIERIWKRQVFLPTRETGRRERRRLWLKERVLRKRAERRRKMKGGRTKCYACGGDHHVNECEKRAQMEPQNACPYCQQMHWSVDCPVKAAKHIDKVDL